MGFKEKEFKEKLMVALDDPEVKNKIRQILSLNQENSNNFINHYQYESPKNSNLISEYKEIKQNYDTLKSKYDALLSKCQKLKNQNDSLDNKIQTLNNNINAITEEKNSYEASCKKLRQNNQSLQDSVNEKENIISEISEKAEKTAQTLKGFIAVFGEPAEYFKRYLNIRPDIRRILSTFISDENAVLFISSCSRFDNLERLWDYIKTILYDESCLDDAKILSDIFYYFFGIFNQSMKNAYYVLDETRIGDRFDDEKHSKGPNSKASGTISRVLLKGFISVNTGDYIRPTIVVV
ncbi:MAG: hypothetical protein PUG48_01495 [Clostridia bacterium]|nr:hypothetical protein [Clostridia bacterium]